MIVIFMLSVWKEEPKDVAKGVEAAERATNPTPRANARVNAAMDWSSMDNDAAYSLQWPVIHVWRAILGSPNRIRGSN